MKAVALFKFETESVLHHIKNRVELSRLEKLFNDLSGECFFVYYASNFTIFPQCFDKRI